MKPGAYNPTRGEEKTIGSTANTPVTANGFRVNATTAGEMFGVYKDSADTDVCRLHFEVGVSIEPGHFKQLWIPGGSTLVIANSVIVAYGV